LSAPIEYGALGAADPLTTSQAKRSSQERPVKSPSLSLAKSAAAFHPTSKFGYYD